MIIIIIIASFYMRFSHEAQSTYSILLPQSLDTFQCRTLLQCTISTPPGSIRFSHEAQSAYSILLPQSLDTFQCRTLIQCTISTPPGEHSFPGIAACDNGAGKFKHNHLSHPTGSPFIKKISTNMFCRVSKYISYGLT